MPLLWRSSRESRSERCKRAFLPCSECRCKSSKEQRAASRLFCATLLRTMATSARSDAAWEYRA